MSPTGIDGKNIQDGHSDWIFACNAAAVLQEVGTTAIVRKKIYKNGKRTSSI